MNPAIDPSKAAQDRELLVDVVSMKCVGIGRGIGNNSKGKSWK